MTETKNYGFQKPDPADLVDVGVINRNFDRVDEALTPYRINTGKDHDFSYAAGEEENISVLNLTELLGSSAAQIIAAFDIGRPVVVSVADSANEFADVSVVLTQKAVYGTSTTLTGMAVNPLQVHYNTVMRFELHLTPDEDSSYIVKLHIMDHMTSGSGGGGIPADMPISVDENGYTQIAGLPRATNIDNVLDGDVLTVTSTLQDGRTIPGTMTFDANGMPESYTEEGVACKFSFTGFEKTAEGVVLNLLDYGIDINPLILAGGGMADVEDTGDFWEKAKEDRLQFVVGGLLGQFSFTTSNVNKCHDSSGKIAQLSFSMQMCYSNAMIDAQVAISSLKSSTGAFIYVTGGETPVPTAEAG